MKKELFKNIEEKIELKSWIVYRGMVTCEKELPDDIQVLLLSPENNFWDRVLNKAHRAGGFMQNDTIDCINRNSLHKLFKDKPDFLLGMMLKYLNSNDDVFQNAFNLSGLESMEDPKAKDVILNDMHELILSKMIHDMADNEDDVKITVSRIKSEPDLLEDIALFPGGHVYTFESNGFLDYSKMNDFAEAADTYLDLDFPIISKDEIKAMVKELARVYEIVMHTSAMFILDDILSGKAFEEPAKLPKRSLEKNIKRYYMNAQSQKELNNIISFIKKENLFSLAA